MSEGRNVTEFSKSANGHEGEISSLRSFEAYRTSCNRSRAKFNDVGPHGREPPPRNPMRLEPSKWCEVSFYAADMCRSA